ncbi:hypothetical protein [Ralstonia solanacearum]|uniref:hypothetical protein n=1 Tax=Ralstonia solanacearum TaxID=305 RepID=UPI002469AFC3|nr:hypothetical protein [Ralstonia solanacearum]
MLGAQRTDLTGTVLLLKSPDLREWHALGELIAPAQPATCTNAPTCSRWTAAPCCCAASRRWSGCRRNPPQGRGWLHARPD